MGTLYSDRRSYDDVRGEWWDSWILVKKTRLSWSEISENALCKGYCLESQHTFSHTRVCTCYVKLSNRGEKEGDSARDGWHAGRLWTWRLKGKTQDTEWLLFLVRKKETRNGRHAGRLWTWGLKGKTQDTKWLLFLVRKKETTKLRLLFMTLCRIVLFLGLVIW